MNLLNFVLKFCVEFCVLSGIRKTSATKQKTLRVRSLRKDFEFSRQTDNRQTDRQTDLLL